MRVALCLLLAASVFAADQELKHDSGKREGKKSRAGSGHVVTFAAPRGKFWVKSVLVHGARYGGGYDPTTTLLTVTICDGRLRALATTEARYSLFSPGRFEWIEIPLEEAVKASGEFKVVVEFQPTARKGVFVGWSTVKKSHSGYGVPGGTESPFEAGKDWMIRVRLTKGKPKTARKPKTNYLRDFDFVARTVRTKFPALKKKGVDWKSVSRTWRPRFAACKDDETHVLNVRRLLATLGDAHTGISDSKVRVHVPSFDGLYGAGLWIAHDGGRLVLRAMMDGHAIARKVKRGAELLTIGGRPARDVHEEVRNRLRSWSGWSSTHFLDARLSFQFFPFGEARRLAVSFRNPGGEEVTVELERWGPKGRGLSRQAVTMPDGLAAKGSAVSKRLGGGIGYIRILGGMSEKTKEQFFEAFDALDGVEGILLDCRGMGGGSDRPAYAMAGRFFRKRTHHLKPTGAWQFDGPVVMLQDEREISSAETFTWAMVETKRAVSVGRPTGGATIIPRSFAVPSGLFRFRLGVHDRRTPILKVQPEGVGTKPDIFVPYDSEVLARDRDPVLTKGLETLRKLVNR